MSFPPDAPEPDAIDQATPADDAVDEEGDVTPPLRTSPEVSEADALDQRREVPLDDEWDR